MSNILKKTEAIYLAALKDENIDKLQELTKKLIEFYKEIPEKDREKFGIEISRIFSTQNDQGKTAVMIDVERGKGEIEENIYLFVLESKNFDMLQKLVNGLVKAYQETTDGKKAYGMESLKIFNLQNSRGETAVMLAAKHDRTDLLKEWYDVPGNL